MTTTNQKIRVSCAHLAVIYLNEKAALLRSKESAVPKYSPVGGHMMCDDEGRRYLESLSGKFAEPSNDLMLYLDEQLVPIFGSWFYQRQNRDLSVARELHEELVEENPILENLEGVVIRHLGTRRHRAESTRKGQLGQMTEYFFDVYHVDFTPEQQERMLQFAATDDRLVLLTQEELSQPTYNGAKLQADAYKWYPVK